MTLLTVGLLLLVVGWMAWGRGGGAGVRLTQAEPVTNASALSLVERGRYLVAITGCNDCHTPMKMGLQGPEPDMSRMLSGHPQELRMPSPPKYPPGPWIGTFSATNTAFAGPWGVTYAINLTPDQQTGLGIWTERMFISALKTGKHMGVSRPIMPPMPWQAVAQMTEEDLKAIYAYLRSIPAISNEAPAYAPPVEADQGEDEYLPAES